ncbi:MAG: hypothetical protein SVU32_08025, partial [Candidatus Nanohaloarchaea archaeon]|nr:hypothetical protein [Candidatus Nanohaloarchaea archaeon]
MNDAGRFFDLKNVMQPDITVSDTTVWRGDPKVITTALQTPGGSDVTTSGIEIRVNRSLTVLGSDLTNSSGEAAVTWTTDCSVQPAQHTLTAALQNTSTYYELADSSDSIKIDVIDNATLQMHSPLDKSNDDAEPYNQGDSVTLNASVNDSCSSNPSVDYDVIWNASDADDSSLIASGEETTWNIPSWAYGNVDVSSYIDYAYYRGDMKTHTIRVSNVIQANLSSAGTRFQREPTVTSGGQDFTLDAQIVTGNGVLANRSNLSEDWTAYNMTWWIDGTRVVEERVTENATSQITWHTTCSDLPAQHSVEVMLQNTTANTNVSLFDPTVNSSVAIIDNATLNIADPQLQEAFYGEELLLNATVDDTCGTADQVNYNVSWTFRDNNTESLLSQKPTDNWIPPSPAYGSGNLTAELTYPYYLPEQQLMDLIVRRKASISDYHIPDYVAPNATNKIFVNVSIPGLADESGYNATFWVDNRSYTITRETDSDGNAVIRWDTHGFAKGAYDSGVYIRDQQDLFVNATDPRSANQTTVIPDVLNVSAWWRDNNENRPGTITADDEDGTNFPQLDDRVVYRNPGWYREPDKLFLAANVTTPFAGSEELYDVNNATVRFWIDGSGAYTGGQITQQIGSCTINMTEYRAALNDNENQWWDEFHCHTSWNPGPDFPVGNYSMIINASHPEGDWDVNPVTGETIEVRGILNVTIQEPQYQENVFQMDKLVLNGTVTDWNGDPFTTSQLDTIRWDVMEDTCDNNDLNWNQVKTAGRHQIDTWVVQYNADYWIGGHDSVRLIAEKTFFEDTRTEYRSSFFGCGGERPMWDKSAWDRVDADGEGYYTHRVEMEHNVQARIDARWDTPTSYEVETNNNDILFVTAEFYEYNTSDLLPHWFDGTFYSTCEDCSDPQNTQIKSQDDDYLINGYKANFTYNFSNENYREEYNFSIWVGPGDYDFVGMQPWNETNSSHKVYKDLGGGKGTCTLNDVCEPADGENVEVCPTECGYDNLPKKFWVNRTAKSSINMTQYNQFRNDSNDGNPTHWLFEPGVSYYEAHSNYSSDGAGGCNFDNKQNDTYEDSDYCPDFMNVNLPPDVWNNDIDPGYYKPGGGPQQQVFADVDDDGTINKVNLTRVSDGALIDTFSTTGGTNWQTDQFSVSGSGNVTYRIYAEDSEGLVNGTMTVEAVADPSAVTVQNAWLQESGPFVAGESISVTVKLAGTGPDPPPQTVDRVELDSSSVISHDTGHNWTGTTTAESDEQIDVLAVELAGYRDTHNATTYTLDTQDPTVSGVSVNDSLVQTGDRVRFYADHIADDGEIANAYVELQSNDNTKCSLVNISDSLSDGNDAFSCNYTVSESPSGTYKYDFVAEDTAGRVTEKTVTVEVDNNPPRIWKAKVTGDGVVQPGSTVHVVANISDAENNLDKTMLVDAASLRGDSSMNVICSDAGFANEGGSTYGCDVTVSRSREFLVYANDSAGNSNPAKPWESNTNFTHYANVTVDAFAPNMSSVNIQDSEVISGSSFTVKVEADEQYTYLTDHDFEQGTNATWLLKPSTTNVVSDSDFAECQNDDGAGVGYCGRFNGNVYPN